VQMQKSLSLEIGRIPVMLNFAGPELRGAALKRYSAFRDAREDALPIHFHATPGAGGPAPSVDFQYALDRARVWLDGTAAHFSGVRDEYALDSLLRVLFSWLLLPQQGFLLHAATVVHNGRACVFTGRSGAGKSTIASLAPPGSVLTDEISLLRREKDAWRAYGTPFWGEFRAAGANRSAPVAGIFVLVQAAENKLRPLRPREALRALLPNVLFFSSQMPANARLLDLLVETVSQAPCYELSFRRDASFWEVLPV
jgi:hypothetical protein